MIHSFRLKSTVVMNAQSQRKRRLHQRKRGFDMRLCLSYQLLEIRCDIIVVSKTPKKRLREEFDSDKLTREGLTPKKDKKDKNDRKRKSDSSVPSAKSSKNTKLMDKSKQRPSKPKRPDALALLQQIETGGRITPESPKSSKKEQG